MKMTAFSRCIIEYYQVASPWNQGGGIIHPLPPLGRAPGRTRAVYITIKAEGCDMHAEDEQISMRRARYDELLALPILSLRELEERDDLMLRFDLARFNREYEAWGNQS